MSSEDTPKRYTPRGFRIYTEFVDTYGKKVDVLESSLATEWRVWIHAEDGSAHLNAEQAEQVRDALDEWLREYYPERLSVPGEVRNGQ